MSNANEAGEGAGWRGEVWPTLRLGFPIMAGMLSQMLIGLADALMVGRVGVIPLAAASFVHVVIHPPLVFTLGLLSAVAVLTAQAFGARELRHCGEILRNGLLVAAVVGLLIVAGMFLLRPFLHLLGQPPEVVQAAWTYLIVFAWSLVPALVAHAAKQFSEALNRAWVPNCILFGGVLLNVLFNWVFIYGHWGSAPLGLEGAGIATLLARLVTMVAMLWYITRDLAFVELQPNRWLAALHLSELKRLLAMGLPVAFQHLLEVSAFAFAGLMMGWISADAIAAHQVALTCAATTFMFPLGLGMAVCIRVGHAWGAGEIARLRRIGFVGLGLAGAIMGTFGLIFMMARFPIAGAFVKSPTVVALSASLLMIAALFQVVDGLQVTAINALRGISDVRVPALIALLAYWIIAVPLGYALAFHTPLGPIGIWTGLALGLGIAALCLGWRFHALTVRTPVPPHPATPSH